MKTNLYVDHGVGEQPLQETSLETLQSQLQAKTQVCQMAAKSFLADFTDQTLFGMERKMVEMRSELRSLARTQDQIKELGGGGLTRIDVERVRFCMSACDTVLGVIQLGRTGNYFPDLIQERDLGSIYKCVLTDDGPQVIRKAMEQIAKIDPSKTDAPGNPFSL